MGLLGRAATAALAARGSVNWATPDNSWSDLGTDAGPNMPPYLSNNPMPHGYPWGTMTANNTNPYTTTPNTGVTRHYNWTISKVEAAPDGVENTLLLVNGQFPGPTIEANWGDWIEVYVKNDIPDEGAAIHWHGILQKQTPYMDGVPGYDQCPIAPGSDFTYRFRADLYGSSWWHAHYSSQYASGLTGPMVIYGPKNVDYDLDLGPVMASDYYHEYYEPIVEGFFEIPIKVTLSDNNLINGKNPFEDNGAPMAHFNFTSGKKIRLRLINPSAAAVERISIDGHTMTVMANDFVPVEPYQVTALNLAVGQRTDVIVEATGAPTDAVWLRAYKSPKCSPCRPGSYYAMAGIFYEDADRTADITSQPQPDAFSDYCGNEPLEKTIPYYPIAAASEADVTEILPIELKSNGTSYLWYMANRTFRVNYNDPILLEAKLGNLDFPYIENVHNYGNNKTIRFVVENTGEQPHPMHLHGHNFQILQVGECTDNATVFGNASGTDPTGPPLETVTPTPEHFKRAAYDNNSTFTNGTSTNGTTNGTSTTSEYGMCWDGSIVRQDNPERRDVYMLLPGMYMVAQWTQDNPGVWPFHCHIAWHLSAGFVWTILERPDDIQQETEIPSISAQTCRDWWAWSKTHIVDQIDDGL